MKELMFYLPMREGVRRRFNLDKLRFEVTKSNANANDSTPKWFRASPTDAELEKILIRIRDLITNPPRSVEIAGKRKRKHKSLGDTSSGLSYEDEKELDDLYSLGA